VNYAALNLNLCVVSIFLFSISLLVFTQGYFILDIVNQEINLASEPAEFIIRKGKRELGLKLKSI
jgi:hypothetical protein